MPWPESCQSARPSDMCTCVQSAAASYKAQFCKAQSLCQPCGLHQLQPAKLVAKIRSMSTSNNLLLFKVRGCVKRIIITGCERAS